MPTTSTTTDLYDGASWPFAIWADDDSQLATLRPFQDVDTSTSLDHLAAAQTWEEVLALPADPTQRLPRMVASGRHLPREHAPVAERPERGRITVTANDGTVSVLAHDGSPLTATGRSSKRARGAAARKANDLLRAQQNGEQMADTSHRRPSTDDPTTCGHWGPTTTTDDGTTTLVNCDSCGAEMERYPTYHPRRYVMVDGEAVDVFNSDGSIG